MFLRQSIGAIGNLIEISFRLLQSAIVVLVFSRSFLSFAKFRIEFGKKSSERQSNGNEEVKKIGNQTYDD